MGQAPEEYQLIDYDLLAEVTETILNSSAPSTRKLYALKWQLFATLCEQHEVNPVNCLIGPVLEFHERLSAGLATATLNLYVATIPAIHMPLVGRDTMVSLFLCVEA